MSIFTADNGTQIKTYTQTIAVAAQAGLTFSANLPDGNVGTPYSGSVTIARQANCSGAVTITVDGASSLPTGLSLGATVDNGDDTFTASVTGTPTTGGTVSTKFDASDGVQTATPLVHSFSMAAAAGLTVVATTLGTPSSGQASGASATFANVQAGDQIIAFYFSGGRLSITFTFSDDQGNTYSTSPITPLTEGMYQAAVATVSANAASLTVSVSAPNSTPTMYALHARGKTLSVDTANVQGARYANLGAAAATAGPYSMSAAGLLLAILSESDETSTDITLTGATGYVADQSNDSYNRTKMVHKITSGAVSGESFQFTATGAASTNDPAYYIIPFIAA